jgi:hypothetical protein
MKRILLVCWVACFLMGCGEQKKPSVFDKKNNEQVEPGSDEDDLWEEDEEEEQEIQPERSGRTERRKVAAPVSQAMQRDELKVIDREAEQVKMPSFEEIFDACRTNYETRRKRTRKEVNVRQLPEYMQLCAMGTSILPLVVRELMNEGNLFALKLYDDLQPDASLKIDPAKCPDERERAIRTVRLWTKATDATTEKAR